MPMPLELHMLGRADYAATVQAMQDYTATRTPHSPDMLLMCEHEAVYTQGLAGKNEHILAPGHIPVVATNRGGQVTFHGAGQVGAYPLMDPQRSGYYGEEYVHRLEEAVLRTLAHFGVTGHRVAGAPGIYVRLADPSGHAMLAQRPRHIERTDAEQGSKVPVPDFTGLGKIAALGIKVSRHCTYHGVALNVAMDLEPFTRIHPCGYAQLRTIDLSTIGVHTTWEEAAQVLAQQLGVWLAP